MKLIRWTPNSGSSLGLHDDIDRLFSGYFSRTPQSAEAATVLAPAVDIEETQDAYVLKADLPGMTQADVKVSLLGDVLTLRGERKRPEPGHESAWRHSERSYGTFERTFKLTRSVRADGVQATYRDGVLEVKVPKAEEARTREIEVQVG